MTEILQSRQLRENASQLLTRHIVIGTRGSALAQWQTDSVVNALKSVAPDLRIERRIIKTAGDKDKARPLSEIGGLGVFTKEIENALLADEIDIAVHSLKDLPTELAPGLTIAAITEREDARDCLVSRHNLGLRQLPKGARVGTSSVRRTAQLLAARPDIQIVPLRGNVDTRLRKAQCEDYDAVVMAAAGLVRLGRAAEITEFLDSDAILPDPGQGALAVEIRKDDDRLADLVSRLDHAPTRAAATAERAFLHALGGGCRTPIGAYATAEASSLRLRGMIGSSDGKKIIRGESTGDTAHAEELGIRLARQLIAHGGADILSTDLHRDSEREHAAEAVPAAGLAQLPRPGTPPLLGRRILVTRSREQAHSLADKIRALGGEPVQVPAIDFAPLDDFRALDSALTRTAEFDWIILTSANGVRAVADRLHSLSLEPGIMNAAKLGAIGPATEAAMKALGLRVDFVPTKFLGTQVAVELPVEPEQSVLLLRADIASERLAKVLASRGAKVSNVNAYRTIMPSPQAMDLDRVDALTCTSSSTVRNLVAMLDGQSREALNRLGIFCIGPVTADTARELGLHVDATAAVHTIDGLLDAMVAFYRRN
jgi:hydroxymethylbilane synthase